MNYFLSIPIIFFCLFISVCHANSEFIQAAKPDWVETINPAPDNTNKGSNGSRYLLVSQQVNLAQEEYQHYYHYRQQVLNESGLQDASQITIDFDPAFQQLNLHQLNLIRDGVVISKLNSAKISIIQREVDLEYSLFDGRKTATIILDDVRTGDIVEYSYSVKGNNPALGNNLFGGFDLQWSVPVAQVLYKIITTPEKPVYFKSHLSNQSFQSKKKQGLVLYRYENTHVPALHVDKDLPSWYFPYPWIQTSAHPNWQAVVDWALPFYKLPQVTADNVIASIVNIGLENKSTEIKLLAALDFVQDQIRYTGIEIGISSYKPHQPSLVMERRFGDCKDKVMLLMSILKNLGFDVYPVLVNSKQIRQLDLLLPSPTDFNHVIVLVKHEGKAYWLDPTIKGQAGNLANIYQPDYGHGLIIKAGNEKLTTIKPNTINKKEVFETFEVNNNDQATRFRLQTIYYGDKADNVRNYLKNNDIKKIEKDYLNFFAKFYPSIQVAADIRTEDDQENNVFRIFEEYLIPEFWKYSETEKRYHALFFQTDLSTSIRSPEYIKRSMPLDIGEKTHLLVNTDILLNEQWPINDEAEVIENEIFKFSRQVSAFSTGKRIRLSYEFVTQQDVVLPKQVENYSEQISQARDMIGYTLYTTELGGNTAKTQSKVTPINWPIIFIFSMSLLLSLAVCYKLFKYDPQPKKIDDDKELIGIKGWLIVPAIGIFLSPIRLASDTYDSFLLINYDGWVALTSPGTELYHPWIEPLIFAELAANTFITVLSALIIILFIKKRSSLPVVYIGFILFYFFIIVADYVAAQNIPSIQKYSAAAEMQVMFLSALINSIWLLYFLFSKRVKATFTVRRQGTKKPGSDVKRTATEAPDPTPGNEKC